MPKKKTVSKLHLYLEIMKLSNIEKRKLKVLPLKNRKDYTLGRSKLSADIILNDQSISRNHLVLKVTDHYIMIYDLGTKNGTFLNSRKIKKAILKIGDMIQVGDTVLTVKCLEKIYNHEDDFTTHALKSSFTKPTSSIFNEFPVYT